MLKPSEVAQVVILMEDRPQPWEFNFPTFKITQHPKPQAKLLDPLTNLRLLANNLLHMNEILILHWRDRTQRTILASARICPSIREHCIRPTRDITQRDIICSPRRTRRAPSTKDRRQPRPSARRTTERSTLFDIVVGSTIHQRARRTLASEQRFCTGSNGSNEGRA